MQKHYSVPIGKTVRHLARIRGGGSALPGLVVEKIDPNFVSRTLSELPRGIVIITGTNGKTTTTKMIVELLESQGLKVFTNRTGSNFSRGVAAALLGEIDNKGKLTADIAVLELDEAHGVHFAEVIQPDYVLVLNVMRDQLDRFVRLNRADQTGQHAEHARLGAARNHAGRRRVGMETAITRPLLRGEHRQLPLEAEHAAVDVRSPRDHARRRCGRRSSGAAAR